MLRNAKYSDKFIIRGLPDDFVIIWQHIKPRISDPVKTEFIRYVTRSGEIRCTDMDGKSFDSDFYDIIGPYKPKNNVDSKK